MKPTESGQKRVLKIQKKIFRSLQREAELLLGKTPNSIKKYELENQKDFRSTRRALQAIQKTELLNSIRSSDVTLIADFHTFEQAQKTALRLAREVVQEDELWYLGLELVPSQFQEILDEFQQGKISTDHFHEAISYPQEWGFPWSNYAPLFDWAKQTGVRLIALNRPKLFDSQNFLEDDLHQRDLWAAGIITDLFHSDRIKKLKPRMVILYGDLHIGNSHLPKQIKQISKSFLNRSLSTVVIHQNENSLYWKLAEEGSELATAITKLKKNTFCVFSSTPWSKLQSLVNWAEGGNAAPFNEEMDDLSLISSYGKSLAEFFKIPESNYESLSTHRIEQTGFLDTLERHPEFSREEHQLIRNLVLQNQRFYIQKLGLAFLGTSSSNGLAELAAIHLLRSRTHSEESFTHFFRRKPEYFYNHLIDGVFGFFGSLILNPKRKCDLVLDHLQRIEALRSGAPSTYKQELLARSLALDVLHSHHGGEPHLLPAISGHSIKGEIDYRKVPPLALFWATRYVGQIYGKNLYSAVVSETISVEWVKKVFRLERDPSVALLSSFPSSLLTFQALSHQLTATDWSGSKNDQL